MGGAGSMYRGAGQRAHIGSFASGGGLGITTAAVDPVTGALTVLEVFESAGDASCLALSADRRVLYAAGGTDHGMAAAYRITADGLAPLGEPVPVAGLGPAHLSVVGHRLLIANYTSGSVSSLPIAADGRPQGPAVVLDHRGRGPDPERQAGPHAHHVVPDPSGRWVLSVDLGTDSVRVCRPDPAGGPLRVQAETPLRAGSGPREVAFHPRGDVAYVIHELEPQLTVCRWDADSGRLYPMGEVALGSGGVAADPREYPSVALVSADGRFIWAAVRGSNLITILSLSDGPEKPRITDMADCGGQWPRHLAAGPSGRHLYVSNEWSGDVTWFDIDSETGRLRPAGRLDVPAAACVVLV
ncbi:lactonase family protein [Streptomyces sp. NRRL F-4474]|uniref:lactonase family protein n=1 Tax=Streptomyces sp. NRRL F-4474 TaxID=1463851 RepID=UPI000B3327EC|nr:lactonase family protein [Streptomyces sp. NRRL F-4474]